MTRRLFMYRILNIYRSNKCKNEKEEKERIRDLYSKRLIQTLTRFWRLARKLNQRTIFKCNKHLSFSIVPLLYVYFGIDTFFCQKRRCKDAKKKARDKENNRRNNNNNWV